MVLEFDRAVMPTGTPRVALTIGEETRHATFSGWNVSRSVYSELSFSYTVQAADRDEDGISIPANAVILDDGAIIRGPEGADADLTHAAVAAERGRKVDGSSVSPPAVKEISMALPAKGDTYELGETISVLVVFDRVVTATGNPRVTLTIGTETRHASFRIGPPVSSYLDFRYTVQAADRDEDGISIPANALILDNGTITAVDGTTDADLSLDAVAADPARKASGSLVSPPVVRSVSMSPPARGDTYELGETIGVFVFFDKAVTVSGDAAHVALNIGGRMRYATVWAGVAGWPLQPRYPAVFNYTVQKRDRDRNGISIPVNALVLNGGTITAADGVTEADLTHAAIPGERGWKVDGRLVRPAAVQGVSFVSSSAGDNEYELGETVEVKVDFDGGVQSTGTPRLALTIGTETRYATIYGLSDHFSLYSLHSSLRFKYAVQAADRDDDGISIPANALALNGGTITAADGVTDADLTHAAVAERGPRMNGSLISPSAVTRIYFISYFGTDDTYELGETIEVRVEFDRAVTATGDPQAALTIGSETRYADLSARGSQNLWFEYKVQEGDHDEDGISIPANALALNGGTITAADGVTDADLTHAAVAERGPKVNGSLISPPAVRRIYLIPYSGRDTYELGETLDVQVEFDRAVTTTGNPRAALTIGSKVRYADLSVRGGSHDLRFEYKVQEGDHDEDGISIPANALVLNGGTIKHAADRTIDANLYHGAMAANPRGKVNGRRARP